MSNLHDAPWRQLFLNRVELLSDGVFRTELSYGDGEKTVAVCNRKVFGTKDKEIIGFDCQSDDLNRAIMMGHIDAKTFFKMLGLFDIVSTRRSNDQIR